MSRCTHPELVWPKLVIWLASVILARLIFDMSRQKQAPKRRIAESSVSEHSPVTEAYDDVAHGDEGRCNDAPWRKAQLRAIAEDSHADSPYEEQCAEVHSSPTEGVWERRRSDDDYKDDDDDDDDDAANYTAPQVLQQPHAVPMCKYSGKGQLHSQADDGDGLALVAVSRIPRPPPIPRTPLRRRPAQRPPPAHRFREVTSKSSSSWTVAGCNVAGRFLRVRHHLQLQKLLS